MAVGDVQGDFLSSGWRKVDAGGGLVEPLLSFWFFPELNKNRRKLFEPPLRSSFLEGGASGRLSRQFHADVASISGRW